nr:ribosomal RNA-processing protein 8 [Misgurnus anguillicaudatus]
MFAEEEWTDSPSADGSHQTVVKKASSTPVKDKVVGKRSLLRTLQTLGSVPDWESEKTFGDSDEEKEKSPAPNKPKKKRCKKRRRSSKVDNVEGEQKEQLDSSETPAKKKKQQPMKKTSLKISQDSSKDESNKGAPVDKEASQTEQILSRKQWKNRMKNKRRCKNKYLPKTTDIDNAKAKKEPLEPPKDLSATQKVQKDKSAKLKTKSRIKNDITVKNNVKNGKDSVKSNMRTDHTQTVSDSISNNKISHELGNKEKPHKMTKQMQIRAEKLRQILKLHHTDDSKTDKHKKEEQENNIVNTKGDAEQTPPDRSSALRSKMEKRLEAARFRHINELLYTSTSGEAKRMFQQDPDAIGIYHRGYTAQVQHWPENPLDSIISYIRQRPASLVVADFGCGDCKVAKSLKNKVHSFDLAPACKLATACDMSKVPLRDSTVDIAVFCLSLMGTNLGDFLKEANRVLVMGGVLKIAEVASRFEDVRSFTGAMSSLGFKLVSKDTENTHFYSFEFIKTGNAPENVKKPGLQLKPCLYKKR